MKTVVLVGPTAVGKTHVSLEVADSVFEIVSADSVQVYRYLNIGSGKPSLAEQQRVKHFLIDVVDPDFSFTAGEFCRRAKEASQIICSSGKIPFFIGGTGLYIDSFFKGLSDIPEIGSVIRNALYAELAVNGLEPLYAELARVDQKYANQIHKNDKQRILRGLEVYRGTGKPISAYYAEKNGNESTKTLYIGLHQDREALRQDINVRTDAMFNNGFVEEVASIRKMGYGPELKSMQSIGYKEINRYLDGHMSLLDTVEAVKIETAKYAKRQMTWFKKNTKINWFKKTEIEHIKDVIKKWLD